MLCPKCHSLLTKGAKYCDICGTRISQEDIQVEEVGSRVKNREKHKKEVRKKTKIIILGIIALVVVIAMLGFILFFKNLDDNFECNSLQFFNMISFVIFLSVLFFVGFINRHCGICV